jgi:hypothetical protein
MFRGRVLQLCMDRDSIPPPAALRSAAGRPSGTSSSFRTAPCIVNQWCSEASNRLIYAHDAYPQVTKTFRDTCVP